MPSYKVLQEVEVLGEKRAVGDVIEVDVETGAPLVDAGFVEVVPEGGATTPATPGSQPASPSSNDGGASVPPPTTPSKDAKDDIATGGDTTPKPAKAAEEPKGWAGNHVVGGNEPNPHKGGGLRDPHPDLKK